MKSILITGGCGFIGSHTCLCLLKENYNLVVLDSNINSSEESLKRVIRIAKEEGQNYKNQVSFFKGDIRDKSLLCNIFSEAIRKKAPIEAVIHFAGLKSIEKSIKEPLLYWENNVVGSIVLFKEMEKFGCTKIVFSSSASIYSGKELKEGEKTLNLSEESDINPNNPYGQTKLAIEEILKNIYNSSKTKWGIINLRYFNPIGAHPSGLIGDNPPQVPDNLFPYICNVASKKFKRLNIYGNDWPTNDGTCVRDFIHIMDLAEAHVSALNYLFENKPKIINLNIGTGVGTSVLELVNTFVKVNKCDVPYTFNQRRSGDLSTLVADNELANKTLNWIPKRSLRNMCEDGWKRQKNFIIENL